MARGNRRLPSRWIVTAMALVLGGTMPAIGAGGTGRLDPTFSGDGIRIHQIGFRDEANDALVGPDGTIYTTGWIEDSSVLGVYIAAYRPDGRSKRSFGTNGRTILDVDDYVLLGTSIARQPNGRFVIAGTKGLSGDEMLLARFEADGDLDKSFSGDGYHVQDVVPGDDDNVEDVVILSDGDIMVVGYTGGLRILLARFNANGTPDTDFGSGGYLLIDGTGSELVNAAVRQGPKILLAGRYEDMPAVLRVDTAGALDGTFGTAGVTKLTTPGDLSSIERQKNGQIVAGGGVFGGAARAVRMSASGVLDSNFGTGGVVDVPALVDQGAGLVIQPRGRLLLAGSSSDATGELWRVVRLTRTGGLDNSFSGDGMQTTDLPLDLARPFVALSQRDGKPLTVGMSGGSGSGRYNSTLIRYRGDVWTKLFRVRKRSGSLRVSGLQFPVVSGQEVIVKLFRRRAGRFVRLDTNTAHLGRARDRDGDGFRDRPFATRFDDPGSGRCKVVAIGRPGAGYGSSKASRRFAC